MKRDLDLYRDQLLQIEELADGAGADLALDYKGTSHYIFQEHLRLLKEGGLIDVDEMPDKDDDSTHYVPIRLTYKGARTCLTKIKPPPQFPSPSEGWGPACFRLFR